MVRLMIYSNENNLVKTLDIREEDAYNKVLKRKKSILDILLDNKVDIYYGCMGGSCSACKCIILSGLDNINKEGLHEMIYKNIEDNEILSCISTIRNFSSDKTIEIKLVL